MTDQRYLEAYDPEAFKHVTYDLETYTPVLTAPEEGWDSEDKLSLEENGQREAAVVRPHPHR